MKKILVVLLTFLALSISFNAIARDIYLDNKAMCEKTKGNWRAFNNSCTDSCNSKFDSIMCTSFSFFACDCGEYRCWDGNKCISEKVAKIFFDERKKEQDEKRAEELKTLEEQNKIAQQNQQIQPAAPVTLTPINPIDGGINPLPPTPTTNPVPAPIDNSLEQFNNEQKQTCTTGGGNWIEFKNGCADHCGNKISEFSICTQEITMGCKCGESQCWDLAKNICVETEEFKKSFMPYTKLQPTK